MRAAWISWAGLFAALACLAADGPSPSVESDKAALAPLQAYVGAWRGAGQPQRGSNKGAWTEQSDWAWHFADGRATIAFKAPKGKYYTQGRIAAGDESGVFLLTATRADGETEDRFTGRVEPGDEGRGDAIVFTAREPAADAPARITLRQVADGARLLMLLEKRLPGDRYTRLAEVGYTREGVEFAAGTGKPECIVTGGAGTIPVTYQGKTYYVCCTGCKELFEADPAKVIAEYQAKQAK